MKTKKEVIEFLEQFPDESYVYPYEGETTCIVVIDKNHKQLGYIDCPITMHEVLKDAEEQFQKIKQDWKYGQNQTEEEKINICN